MNCVSSWFGIWTTMYGNEACDLPRHQKNEFGCKNVYFQRVYVTCERNWFSVLTIFSKLLGVFSSNDIFEIGIFAWSCLKLVRYLKHDNVMHLPRWYGIWWNWCSHYILKRTCLIHASSRFGYVFGIKSISILHKQQYRDGEQCMMKGLTIL